LNECEGCRVIDVSPAGFSLISAEDHHINDIVTATVQYGGIQYSGRARVQSKRTWKDGHFRYGLYCIDRAFREAVQQLAMEVQRQKLRRLAALK
jgi:hypothetical protein